MPDPAPRDPDPWYVAAFDASYAARYAHRDDAEARRQIATLRRDGHLRAGARVLDLCCGAGRHLVALRDAGHPAIGVDLSADLLRAARAADPEARLSRADMASLPFRERAFDAVVQMFTAFGYFERDEDNREVLREVARVLVDGGAYALDLMNRAPLVRDLVPESRRELDGGATVVERRRFDPDRGRVEKEIVSTDARGEARVCRESVRVLTPDELRAWMTAAGLSVVEVYGDYGGARFDPETSPRMLAVARRRE